MSNQAASMWQLFDENTLLQWIFWNIPKNWTETKWWKGMTEMFIEAVWTGERFVKYLSAVANAMSWNLFLTLLARKIVFFLV